MKTMLFLLVFTNIVFASGDSLSSRLILKPPARRFHQNMLSGSEALNSASGPLGDFKKYSTTLSIKSTIAQPVVASAVGMAMGVLSGLAGAAIAGRATKYSGDEWAFAGFFYGAFAGDVFGNGFASWHFAKLKYVDGSFEGTLMGSLVGGFLGLGAAAATENWRYILLGPPIGATITFHLTKEP